ncbi:MAG: thioredoxin family protein [Flavobacteriales bacterium]|nr:thioredoxin family protein [Flavobacteriales bacterium]
MIRKLFLIFLSAGFGYCSSVSAQVSFSEGSFRELVEEAAKTDKLLMVDAYTDWCGWCKVMDRETFSDSLVGEYVNPRMVSTKVNMEEGFGIELAMKYRVSSYPQYLFFDGEGNLVSRLSGFMEPGPFMEKLQVALSPENYLPTSQEPLKFDMDYPEFYKTSFLKRKDRSYPSAEELMAWLNSRESLTDEVTWGVVTRFVNNGDYVDSITAKKDELVNLYGKEEVTAKFSSFIFSDVKSAIKSGDRAMLNEALRKADRILGAEAESYKTRYKMYYYQMTQDWENYAALGLEQAKNGAEPAALNQMAWAIYENCEVESAIKKAISWMKPVVENTENAPYAHLDTYAALLYKSRDKEKAMKFARLAIAKAEEEGEDAAATEELLVKIEGLK